MIASAQQLADWLRQHPFPGCSRPTILKGAVWEATVRGRTGVIFFKDYWRRRGETKGNGSGDHIDLWNKDTLTPSMQSFLRFTIGVSRFPNLNPFTRRDDNQNWYSDLGNCDQVWFWPVQ